MLSGDPAAVLAQLCTETGAGAVFAQRDDSPFAVRRDAAVQAALPVALHLKDGIAARPPESVVKDDGEPFVVYTPFGKRWRAFGAFRRSDILPAPQADPHAARRHAASRSPPRRPCRRPCRLSRAKLRPSVASGLSSRAIGRRFMPMQSCATGRAQTQPHSCHPTCAGVCFRPASQHWRPTRRSTAPEETPTPSARKGADTWLAELIWREFYIAILHFFPYVRGSSFRREFNAIPWRNDAADFAAWCEGRTGYPIVDAAMRQLAAEGWMHNRCRMITASFLVKDLLIDWRWGERFFMQHLVDGDPAPNNGGWQWTAGTGTDAAPYFRVFNPVLQGQKFDPQGVYIRRWLPELAGVALEFLHEPWKMQKSDQIKARCVLGVDYPLPIVDHHAARERVLEAYAAVKG